MQTLTTGARKAVFHLPGLFEFYELYRVFLPLFHSHREYFYDWCEIGSLYGAPADCLWGGGRVGFGEDRPEDVYALTCQYGVSARLTFSNSLLREEHLSDRRCNALCELFVDGGAVPNGVILTSDLLLDYLRRRYPSFYFVSSTTKVLTKFTQLRAELEREEFRFVVPDFRLNRAFDRLDTLPPEQKQKLEFLCNECCAFDCADRKACYENVSRKSLEQIQNDYLPRGLCNFKLEGRSLGSAVILEFLLYYLTRPAYQLRVREEIYLDSALDLF